MEMTTAMAPTIEPTPEQFQRLAQSDDAAPVIMINLLRFKDRADGIDADDGISGAEAYQRYADAVRPFLEGVGGRVLIQLAATESVVGPAEPEWHVVLAVEYPSRAAFLKMASDIEYAKIHGHRAAALADSRLIASVPASL
jgi:uncharacterized protein (DUF1330 family)